MAANWVPPHKLIFTFIARWRIIICDTWVKKHDMFFYGEKYQRYWFFILLFLEFKCKIPLISGIHLPKLWSRITDRMILFWYDSLKEENYTCMKMLRHSVLFLVNVAICWWQSMHFYGAKIPIIGLYHRARTENDTEFKLISVLVFHTC